MRYPELAVELGRRITKIRTGKNKSVAEFATLCHIELTTMYDIEAGKQCSCIYSIIKICRYTNTDYNYLLKGLEPLVDVKYDCKKVK